MSEMSEPEPAPQVFDSFGKLTPDLKQHGFWALLFCLQTPGLWFPNEMQILFSSDKRTLDHWATVQLFFSSLPQVLYEICLCVASLDAPSPASVLSLWHSMTFMKGFCLRILSKLWLFLLDPFWSNIFSFLSTFYDCALWTTSLYSILQTVFWTSVQSTVFAITEIM